MPAVSKKQKTAMCMALAARKGDLEVNKLKGAALDIYKSDMTNKEIEDFTVMKEHVELKEFIQSDMKNLTETIKESRISTRDIKSYVEFWVKYPETDKEMYEVLGAITEALQSGLEYREDLRYLDGMDDKYKKASEALKKFVGQLK